MLAADDPDVARVGAVLLDALQAGGSVDRALGLVPQRGSRATVAAAARAERLQRLLGHLLDAAGSVRRAASVLRGDAPPPAGFEAMLAELKRLQAPRSPSGIHRAVARHR